MLFAREYRKVKIRHEIASKLIRRETWVTGSGLTIAFLGVMEIAPSGLSPELLATAATLSGVGGLTTIMREKQRKDERVSGLITDESLMAHREKLLKEERAKIEAMQLPDAPGFEPDPRIMRSQSPDGQQVTRRR